MVNLDILLSAVETSMFLLPELPGRVEWLNIPGLRGRISAGSDLFANLAGASTLDGVSADATVHQVYDLFAGQNKEFGWVVGPLSTPADLPRRLEGAGLELAEEMAGMILTDLSVPIRVNPAVRIREASPADLEPASFLLASALGIPPDGAHLITEALLLSQGTIRGRVYLAYLENGPEPVGYASMVYLPGQPVVALYCAATQEAYRGQGVYTSLVARRLEDAYRDGFRAAVIQAVRETSAPICRKLGFAEIGGLEWYAWFP